MSAERTGARRAPAGGGTPVVSVVLATRDRVALLRRAVVAVLEQDYDGEIEVLVVFDQSEPVELDLPATPRRRVRVLRNDRRPGLAGGRNTGVLAATGALVAFCDDDDEWLPGKLSRQVPVLGGRPDAAAVFCGIEICYRDRRIRRVPPVEVGPAELARDRVMALHPSALLTRREALLGAVGLVDEAIPGSYGEDYDWLLRAAATGPVLAVPEVLARIHWHPQSFFAQRWAVIAEALPYLLDKHPLLRADRRGLARIEGQVAFALASAGRRRAAGSWALRGLRHSAAERRAWLALAVGWAGLPPRAVLGVAQVLGRGI